MLWYRVFSGCSNWSAFLCCRKAVVTTWICLWWVWCWVCVHWWGCPGLWQLQCFLSHMWTAWSWSLRVQPQESSLSFLASENSGLLALWFFSWWDALSSWPPFLRSAPQLCIHSFISEHFLVMDAREDPLQWWISIKDLTGSWIMFSELKCVIYLKCLSKSLNYCNS